jgi:hypothetical protein
MQLVEEFMQQYFDERIAEEKREQAGRAPFRRKFHTDDCFWDSRAGTLEMIQTETVLRASASDGTAEVITTRHSPPRADSVHQLRYHLQASQGRWLIRAVDVWCHSCRGEAKADCIFCHGTGWFDGRKPKTPLPKSDIPPFRRF